ncbi:hypothetical protein FACS1894193_11960 [Bacilli bacterium]|nr:hypothetical protein FACS1894193_11960 [Bacilli bacterium]
MKKLIFIFVGTLFLGLFNTQVSAAEKTTFAFYDGWGLGYFDENAKFVPRDEIPKEEFKSYPYGWGEDAYNIHLIGNILPVPFVRYDESQKKTGYWTRFKFGQLINQERFVEVKYPVNSDVVSEFVHGPFLYHDSLCYLLKAKDKSVGSGLIGLPRDKVDTSQYPVLHTYSPEIIGEDGRPDLNRQVWYMDKAGVKFEFTAPHSSWVGEEPSPDGINPLLADLGQSNAFGSFILDDKRVTIPDITDPKKPLSPDTPNEVDDKTVASELSLTQYPKAFNFGLHKVSAKENSAVFVTNQESNSKIAEKEGVQVHDGRLHEKGYGVTAEFTGFTLNGRDSLKGASIELADKVTNLSLTDTGSYSAQQKGFSLSKDSAPTIVLETDNAKFFTGNYWNEEDVQLIIPKGGIEIGTHEGVVVWTLQTKPSA